MEVNSQKKVVLIIYSCCKTYRLKITQKQRISTHLQENHSLSVKYILTKSNIVINTLFSFH